VTNTAIEVLGAVAAMPSNANWLAIEERSGRSLSVRASVRGDDGEERSFRLVVAGRGDNIVTVREHSPQTVLPGACPERHINHDGSFCLGPKAERIETIDDATKWCANLAGFLELQLRANETGSWSRAYAWPHGAAADAQMLLESEEKRLPAGVARALDGARLRFDENLVGRRLRCPCGKKRQTRRCHERAILLILKARADVVRLEREFWAAWTSPCCRTMASCPLNIPMIGAESSVR
jgi:hypothetical protein